MWCNVFIFQQYCEEVIKKLQIGIIRHSVELTTASHNSLEKDKTIQRLSQDWAKVKKFWEEVNNRHKNLVQDLQTEREMSRQKNLEISKVSIIVNLFFYPPLPIKESKRMRDKGVFRVTIVAHTYINFLVI